jgi:hypothetical protein
MKPQTPENTESLKPEGMMFVGDKGMIIAGFRGENPVLFQSGKAEVISIGFGIEDSARRTTDTWIESFKNNTPSPGSFLNAGPVTETILLGGVALRARKRVDYDSSAMKITNDADSNKFLTRDYRKGWEL